MPEHDWLLSSLSELDDQQLDELQELLGDLRLEKAWEPAWAATDDLDDLKLMAMRG